SLGSEYQFRQVPTWSPVRTLSWEVWSYPGWVAFSPDNRLVALEISPGVIRLIDAETGAAVARLTDPTSDRARWIGFTSDASRLVTVAQYAQAIHIWDFAMIERGLAALGLADGFTPLAPSDRLAPSAYHHEILADFANPGQAAVEQTARDAIER